MIDMTPYYKDTSGTAFVNFFTEEIAHICDFETNIAGTVCLGEDNRYYRVGEAFRMVDECYFCRFDSKCNMQCKDDGFCSLSRFDVLPKNLIAFFMINKSVRPDREKNIYIF